MTQLIGNLLQFLSALKRWRHYLLGAHFIVRSDHASLRWLQSQPQLSCR